MSGDHRKWQAVIDAGLQGAHTAGHGHADALSVTLTAAGRELLSDSGTFEYVGPDFERDRFRGTSAHNTLMVGGKYQAQPRGPFGWQRLPLVQAEGWITGRSFDLFMGSHDGYCRLPNPVIHRRYVFALKSGLFLVRDLVLGFGEYPLDLFWHLGPGLTERDSGFFFDDGSGVRIVTEAGHGWTRAVEDQSHSPVYGVKQTHKALHFASSAKLPTEFVTLLMPVSEGKNPEGDLTRIPASSDTCVGYRYRASTDEHCFFFGAGSSWKMEPWSTDAEFLYLSLSDGVPGILVCCNASLVEWEGQRIISAKSRVLRCELSGTDPVNVVSSDPDSVTVDNEAWKMLLHSSRVPVKTV
jgi:hypothetical protein